MDMPPVRTKAEHFLRQILKTVDFEHEVLTGTFRKRHQVNTREQQNETFFNSVKTRLIDSEGADTFWHRIVEEVATSLLHKIYYRFRNFAGIM